MTIRLITVDPEQVVAFCKAHPVDMKDAWREQTIRGGTGDIRSPTPAVEVFFQLYLVEKGGVLPTQAEYVDYCRHIWHDWYALLKEETGATYVQRCFEARLCRNFYPSCLDSVHCWALLGTRFRADGHLVFDRCILDTYADVVTKADLLAYRGGECLRIALRVGSMPARQASTWKHRVRQPRTGTAPQPCVELVLPLSRVKIGGKRWFYWPDDFRPVFQRAEQLWLPGFTWQETS